MKLTIVPAFSTESNVYASVYLLDCIWELFVVVGMKARNTRRDIHLALSVARVRQLLFLDIRCTQGTSGPFLTDCS
jgi:hypothetical protein